MKTKVRPLRSSGCCEPVITTYILVRVCLSDASVLFVRQTVKLSFQILPHVMGNVGKFDYSLLQQGVAALTSFKVVKCCCPFGQTKVKSDQRTLITTGRNMQKRECKWFLSFLSTHFCGIRDCWLARFKSI